MNRREAIKSALGIAVGAALPTIPLLENSSVGNTSSKRRSTTWLLKDPIRFMERWNKYFSPYSGMKIVGVEWTHVFDVNDPFGMTQKIFETEITWEPFT